MNLAIHGDKKNALLRKRETKTCGNILQSYWPQCGFQSISINFLRSRPLTTGRTWGYAHPTWRPSVCRPPFRYASEPRPAVSSSKREAKKGSSLPSGKKEKFTHETRPKPKKEAGSSFQLSFFRGELLNLGGVLNTYRWCLMQTSQTWPTRDHSRMAGIFNHIHFSHELTSKGSEEGKSP